MLGCSSVAESKQSLNNLYTFCHRLPALLPGAAGGVLSPARRGRGSAGRGARAPLHSLHSLPRAPRRERVTARGRARAWLWSVHTGFHLASTSLRWELLGATPCEQSMESCFALCCPSRKALKWSGEPAGVCQRPFCAAVNLPWRRAPLQVCSQELSACPEPRPSLTEPGKNGTRQSMHGLDAVFVPRALPDPGRTEEPLQLTGAWQGPGTPGRAGHGPCPLPAERAARGAAGAGGTRSHNEPRIAA